MDTNERIQDLLRNGEHSAEALDLAAEHDVHTLSGKLKAWYENLYGRIAADIHDWHWHATALKNHVRNQDGDEHEDGKLELTHHADNVESDEPHPAAASADEPDAHVYTTSTHAADESVK